MNFGAQAHCVVWALRSQGIKNPRRRRGLSVGRYAHRAVKLDLLKEELHAAPTPQIFASLAVFRSGSTVCSVPAAVLSATDGRLRDSAVSGLFRLKPCRTNLHELPQLPSQRNELVFPSAALLLCFEESSYQHVSAMSATWQTWQTTTSHACSIYKRVSVNRVAPTSSKNTRPLLLDWRTILPASGQQGRPRQSPH